MGKILAMKFLLFTPGISIGLALVSLLTSNSGISKVLFFHNWKLQLATRDLTAFYVADLTRFLAPIHLYRSAPSLLIILACLVAEMADEALSLLAFSTIHSKCFKNKKSAITFVKLTIVKFTQFWRLSQSDNPRYYLGKYKRNKYERIVGLIWIICCVVFPSLADDYGLWMLLSTLAYSIVLVRYENPCLMDLASVVFYFGSLLLRLILSLTIYKAIALRLVYLSPLPQTWWSLIKEVGFKYLIVIGFLILLTTIDFFLIKNLIFSSKSNPKTTDRLDNPSRILEVRSNRTTPPTLIITHQGTFNPTTKSNPNLIEDGLDKSIKVVSPIVSGIYLTTPFRVHIQWNSKIIRLRNRALKPPHNWQIIKKFDDLCFESLYVGKVMVDFRHQPTMIAHARKHLWQKLFYLIEVYDLRRRKKVFESAFFLGYMIGSFQGLDTLFPSPMEDLVLNFDSSIGSAQIFWKWSSDVGSGLVSRIGLNQLDFISKSGESVKN